MGKGKYTITLSKSGSQTSSDYGWWALSRQGRKAIHHLAKDRDSLFTKCGRPIAEPYWFKLARHTWWPPGKTKAQERARMCKRCKPME